MPVQCEAVAFFLSGDGDHFMQYLTLGEAAKTLPTRPSTQTLFRWCTRGCRGVKLESLRFGRRIVVTPEALDKFARELAEAWNSDRPQSPTGSERAANRTRTSAQREKAILTAEANLAAKGMR